MKKKKFWGIIAGVLVAEVLVAAAFLLWPKPLPEVSDLFLRYADDPGVEVSFVKRFHLDDTLAVDATILRARDSVAWSRLAEQLELPAPQDPVVRGMSKGIDLVTTHFAKKGSAAPVREAIDLDSIDKYDVIGVSYLNRTVSIYHTHTRNELRAIIHYHTEISTKNSNI